MIKFTVDIDPVGKGRPRFARRGRFVHTFTPLKTRSFENALLEKAAKYVPKEPIRGAISLKVFFYIPVPVSRMREYEKLAEKAGEDFVPHVIKPDIDNLLKASLDPMNGVFWVDDAQIVNLLAFKFYSLRPRIEYEMRYGDEEFAG